MTTGIDNANACPDYGVSVLAPSRTTPGYVRYGWFLCAGTDSDGEWCDGLGGWRPRCRTKVRS